MAVRMRCEAGVRVLGTAPLTGAEKCPPAAVELFHGAAFLVGEHRDDLVRVGDRGCGAEQRDRVDCICRAGCGGPGERAVLIAAGVVVESD